MSSRSIVKITLINTIFFIAFVIENFSVHTAAGKLLI